MSDAFIYLWYDAPNKKYYLGKHKGTPDDSYTHSSRVWESFTKNNIPEGVSRRILAYGTDEEMCILEHKLLVNRKKRCWDRYYNQSLGDPRHVDVSGENNPMWKGGVTNDKEYQLEKNRENYWKNPEKYRRKNAAKKKRLYAKWKQDPEYMERKRKYERDRGYTREEMDRRNQLARERRARKKAERQAERQGVGTLEAFLK